MFTISIVQIYRYLSICYLQIWELNMQKWYRKGIPVARKEKRFETSVPNLFLSVCCLTRIRTSTDRTKNCSATITPWDNPIALLKRCKGKNKILPCKFFDYFFTLRSTNNNFSYLFEPINTYRQAVKNSRLQYQPPLISLC